MGIGPLCVSMGTLFGRLAYLVARPRSYGKATLETVEPTYVVPS